MYIISETVHEHVHVQCSSMFVDGELLMVEIHVRLYIVSVRRHGRCMYMLKGNFYWHVLCYRKQPESMKHEFARLRYKVMQCDARKTLCDRNIYIYSLLWNVL
jgi:hypothetical protein